jgi:hypothetical protein
VYPKVSGLSHNEINNNNNNSLKSNTKSYGGKTNYTDSQNSDATAPTGRKLHHWQFSLQAAGPETFDTLSFSLKQNNGTILYFIRQKHPPFLCDAA